MPHATSMPSSGFQALILCGPGASLGTFTGKPEDFPKAIIPIANRPMVWYALDYCYRMGVNDIYIVTPPASHKVIEDTMNTNPYLTSLPNPRPSIIAPANLTYESGTADILRQPEVRKAITGDFVVLPCDLVSELPGESLLEAWMIQQDGLEGPTSSEFSNKLSTLNATSKGKKGGLGVWYPVKDAYAFKNEETDMLITSPLAAPVVPPPISSTNAHIPSVRGRLEHLMSAMPTDTMNDIVEAQTGQDKFLPIRPGILRRSGRVKMRTAFRDSHLYIFPHWVFDFVKQVPELDSMSEDVVGSWAKATWQPGFADKLDLKSVLEDPTEDKGGDNSPREGQLIGSGPQDDEIMNMVSTRVSDLRDSLDKAVEEGKARPKLQVPPFLSYIHPIPPESANEASTSNAAAKQQASSKQQASNSATVPGPSSFPLVRRVDTAPMLLSISLRLAKLESIEDAGIRSASHLAHQSKVSYPAGIAPRSTVSRSDSLLDLNVTVEERCVVKESVIGANCVIKAGARLTRCLLMDSVVVGEKCQLTDCIVGRRAKIGKESVLKECRVQDGNVVADETEAKGEDIMVFEGLDEEGDFGEDEGDVGQDGTGFALG